MKRKSGKRENNPFSVLLCICTALMLVVIATPVQAETVKMRIFSHVHKMHVIPIGFAKAPANVIFERGGMANLENGEMAVYLARGAVKATPKGGSAEGFSQLTFSDESSYVTKWEVTFTKDEKTKLNVYTGKGTYVSGTGRFEGIQGEVTISGRQLTPMSESTRSDAYYDVAGTYSLPSK